MEKYLMCKGAFRLWIKMEDWIWNICVNMARLLVARERSTTYFYEQCGWNGIDLIYSTFIVEEADQIVSLPIPITNQSDKVIWSSENLGIYSVKSGYKMLLNPPNLNLNEKKRLIIGDKCSCCRKLCESFTYVVRDCLFAAQVWSKLNFQWSSSIANSNFIEWLNWLLENSASIRKDDIAITIWALWFSRNKYLHEKKTQSTEEVVTFIRGFGMKFWGSTLTLKHPKPRSMVKWVPLPQGWVKINVDAGFSVANKHVVSGFIIRNAEGLIMGSGSGFKGHNLVQSVRLQYCMGTNLHWIWDSQTSFLRNIQQTSEDYSKSRPFTWDAKNLARNFSSCRFQFVARERNVAAHVMAI
ncbi:reverse transcriptase [Gossypium australe]|uniref:Reverse transcriptase n=1 Tax=Gossypium australe TaxID=47621 RepID=A0A5B6VJY7_9ROSI|nr:reverse transcriptase [Gossypium australe]